MKIVTNAGSKRDAKYLYSYPLTYNFLSRWYSEFNMLSIDHALFNVQLATVLVDCNQM